jgi:hypothetical protein
VTTRLMGVELASEFVHTIVLTGSVENANPVSAMIVANPEQGKTSVVLEKSCDSVIPLTDVTGKGLKFLCQMKPEASHFIINDMGIVMAHSGKSREYFFGMLLAMTEEGIRTTASPDGVETIKTGKKAIIGCITSDQARDNRSWWQRRGLARRLVPFHYGYSEALVVRIKNEIVKGHHVSFTDTLAPSYPKGKINVAMDAAHGEQMRKISDNKANRLGQLGISLLLRYQAMAKGHALYRSWKNPRVNDDDIDFLMRCDPYIDWENPGLFL